MKLRAVFTEFETLKKMKISLAIFKKSFFLLLFILGFSPFKSGNFVFAQGEANWWYFGWTAGLDFTGGAPVAVTNGQLTMLEGSSSISDAAGNLLFYTNGIQVWNRNHVQMPNGFGLLADFSSTQAALIVKRPGSSTIYYIFTSDAFGQPNGIRYTEENLALNAGLGDVTATKNVFLYGPSCEKLAGIRHCNGQDVWVVTHTANSNAFRTFRVTAAGVNPAPVVSNAGLPVSGAPLNDVIGQLKGSPDGTKLASASHGPNNRFELFDFNNSTGIISNAILFPSFTGSSGGGGTYGVEFSPDGTRMYGVIDIRDV